MSHNFDIIKKREREQNSQQRRTEIFLDLTQNFLAQNLIISKSLVKASLTLMTT